MQLPIPIEKPIFMRNLYFCSLCSILLLFIAANTFAQVAPGTIIRPAASVAGRAVLDPNTTYNFPGNSSKFAAGFGSDDVTNSEIPYKPIPALSYEPFADLRRGPNHSFSDFVPDGSDDGVYAYFDNTNLLFRFRMGTVMSGSKGYSVLIDTDGKFGATGAAADPNYQAATTGTNGNPGFEIELVLETNFQIGIYNVDGSSNPILIKAYTAWQEKSQISIASTNDNGDPDFYMDFFIPFSDLTAAPFNLTTASPIRLSATTVMAPKPAIGGPKSDIYGVNDELYKNPNEAYEAFIKGQCSFGISSLQTASTCPVCTEAPVLNSPISVGTVNISGTWAKSTLPGTLSIATITVYKNGTTVLGTVANVVTGSTWLLNNVAIASGDIITARAQASGESMCLISNAVTANTCNTATRPAMPVLTCIATGSDFNKGVTGSNLATGWVVHVENTTRGTLETSTANAGQFTTAGTSPNITWNYAGGCSGGPNMPSGSYKVYYTNASGCISQPVYFCVTGNGGSALAGTTVVPTITSPSNGLTTGTNSITGTGEANSSVALFVNGTLLQTVTATAGGSFTFSNLAFLVGQQVTITNVLNTGTVATSKCLSSSATFTITCNTAEPIVTTDANGQLAAGQSISGTGSKQGDVIRIYLTPSTLVATTTVQANGTWSTANSGTTPTSYSAVAGSSYFATAQSSGCGISGNSSTITAITPTAAGRCGSIAGTVAPNATSVSGTLTGSFTTSTVNLYLDGTLIGNTTTNTASWGPIAVNTTDKNTTLYPNGILTIGIKETGRGEVLCAASASAISCTPIPMAPIISPTNSVTSQNGTVTYTISNAVAGTFYALSEAVSGESLGSGTWASTNGSLNITTKQLSTTKTYDVLVKATSLNGIDLCTSLPGSATITVSSTLPVTLSGFTGRREANDILLNWETLNETAFSHFVIERSVDGANFNFAGRENAKGASGSGLYHYKDAQAPAGRLYYRLKMIDLNGAFTYSKTLVFSQNAAVVQSVRPNPFVNQITTYLALSKAQQVTLTVGNLNGGIIKQMVFNAARGNNTFTISQLQHLSKGLYLLTINTADEAFQQKLLKIN